MVTFVKNQETFAEAIHDLVELVYYTKAAYEEAIKRLENDDNRSKLKEFCKDHENHIIALSKLLEKHHQQPPKEPKGISGWTSWIISKGKVAIADIVGDNSILLAMSNNETDTNKAYERINARHDQWPEAKEILIKALKDENKHKEWFDNLLEGK